MSGLLLATTDDLKSAAQGSSGKPMAAAGRRSILFRTLAP